MRKILVADLLCGAGGSSTGAARALAELGLKMELVCVNHWGVAIETHKRNHPEARHYCQDIASVRPHLVVPEGYLDLLMASPTCTHHSVARGGKPTSDQQRSDPWHIITWLTELRVRRMIIENVWEFCGWGPVDPRTGKPIKARKGEYFRAWINAIRALGFDPEWRKLNAADYGDATTRQRFILMARSDGRSVCWPVPTHRKRDDGSLALFPGVKPWRPARDIIDWRLKGKSIFSRPKPLAPKTLARIYAGAVKFKWPEPFLVILRNHMAGMSIDGPLPPDLASRDQSFDGASRAGPTCGAANGNHVALAEPILCGNRTNNAPKSPDAPVGGITTTTGGGHFLVEPVIVNGRRGNKAKGVSGNPVPALDTKGGVWLAEPIILSQQNSGAPRSSEEPLPTITTGGSGVEERQGCARHMLVEPFVLNRHGDNGGVRAHSIDDPMPTAVDRGAGYVVEPFVATVAHGNSEEDATADERRCKSVEEPLGAQHGGGGKFAVVEAFVLSQASGGAPRAASDPLPTIVAGGQRGSGTALITSYYGASKRAQSADEPLATVTTKDRFGIVVPVTHADGSQRARDVETDPLPTLTTANRGELAFITAQFGEREGQAPRVHDIAEPAPAICAQGHVNLVEGTWQEIDATNLPPGTVIESRGQEYDILFRMLEPHELAAAMGFNSDEASYEFAGTKTEKIRQIGNAVSVAKMQACVGAIMADAAPKRRSADGSLNPSSLSAHEVAA